MWFVEAGAFGHETRTGAGGNRGRAGASGEVATGFLAAGAGAAVPAGATLTLRALGDEPATALVVAILPAAATAAAP
jgi:hypothetical protein